MDKEIFSNSNPLRNYKNFIWEFETFLQNCESEFNFIKKIDLLKKSPPINPPDYEKNLKSCKIRIKEFCLNIENGEIRSLAHIGKQEIENQVFTNYYDSDRLLIWVQKKLLELGNKLKLTTNNLDIIEYRDFFDSAQIFWDFYNWFFKEGEGFNEDIKRNEHEKDIAKRNANLLSRYTIVLAFATVALVIVEIVIHWQKIYYQLCLWFCN